MSIEVGQKMRCSICGSAEHTKPLHGKFRRGTNENRRCSICGEFGHYKNWHKQEEIRNLTEKICESCLELLPISEFGKDEEQHRKNGDGLIYLHYSKICRICANKKHENNNYKRVDRSYKTIDDVIHRRYINSIKRSGEMGIDFDLTPEYIRSVFDEQDGKCFYSGIQMELSGSATLSIDRIDSDLGYTKNNVVLCCGMVNLMKRDTTSELFIDVCGKIWNHQS